jgi:transposase-like protein
MSRCPSCKGSRVINYGHTSAGRQKLRCTAPGCRRQFVAGSNHLVDPKIKVLVEGLLSEDVPPKKIAAAMPPGKISLRWIYSLRGKLKPNDR